MKIALLSTSYLESFYKKELKELDLADIIDVYVYYTYEHVVDLYRQISEQYDGILAGGTAPMRIIQKAYPKHKPMRNIEVVSVISTAKLPESFSNIRILHCSMDTLISVMLCVRIMQKV